MEIRVDDVCAPVVVDLLREHHQDMMSHSPPESVHTLPVEDLRRPDVTFWTAWDGDELLGCGALREIDRHHAEIKSMRTASAHLRRGVARGLLAHLVQEAGVRGYQRLSLETGSMAAFVPAHELYTSFGFRECGPFADYREDPNSVFMTRLV